MLLAPHGTQGRVPGTNPSVALPLSRAYPGERRLAVCVTWSQALWSGTEPLSPASVTGLASLSLSFPICKVEAIAVPTEWDCCEGPITPGNIPGVEAKPDNGQHPAWHRSPAPSGSIPPGQGAPRMDSLSQGCSFYHVPCLHHFAEASEQAGCLIQMCPAQQWT